MRYLILFVCIGVLFWHTGHLEASEPIKVASVFAKTGKVASQDGPPRNGIRFAIEEVNKNGGVLGRYLELLEFDNHSTAIGAKGAAQKAINAGATVVFGASWSSHSLAMAPVLQKAGILMITPYSTNPQVTLVGNYIFRICYTDQFQGRLLANFAYNDVEAKTAGVLINADSQYSQGLAEYFISNFNKLGGDVVFVEHYLEETANFRKFIEKAQTLKPDVVFHPGHYQVSAYVFKQTHLSGVETTFLGGDGWNDKMYDIAGDVISGSYFSNHWHAKNPSETSRKFMERYKKKSRKIDPGHALSEDCVFIFVDAVKRAGSIDSEKIRDTLAATKNFQGITGNISFNKHGDPIKPAVIMKFEKGKSVYLKTIDP